MYTVNTNATTKITQQRVISDNETKEIKSIVKKNFY